MAEFETNIKELRSRCDEQVFRHRRPRRNMEIPDRPVLTKAFFLGGDQFESFGTCNQDNVDVDVVISVFAVVCCVKDDAEGMLLSAYCFSNGICYNGVDVSCVNTVARLLSYRSICEHGGVVGSIKKRPRPHRHGNKDVLPDDRRAQKNAVFRSEVDRRW